MDFIELFNEVVRIAKPAQSEYVDAQTFDDRFEELDIDSLDGLMMVMYLCEIYGVPDTASREWHPVTVGELYELLKDNGSSEPETVEEAIRMIR